MTNNRNYLILWGKNLLTVLETTAEPNSIKFGIVALLKVKH